MLIYDVLAIITKYMNNNDTYHMLTANENLYSHINLFYKYKIIDCNQIILLDEQQDLFEKVIYVKNSNDLVEYMPNVANDKEERVYILLTILRGYLVRLMVRDIHPISESVLQGYDNILKLYIMSMDNELLLCAILICANVYILNICSRLPHEDEILIKRARSECLKVSEDISKICKRDDNDFIQDVKSLSNKFFKEIFQYGNFVEQ